MKNMLLREVFVLAFIVCVLHVQFSTARLNLDEEDNDDAKYRLLKRFLFHKTTAATTKLPSVLGNLVRPSTERPPIWTQKSTSSPYYPSSSACTSNSCANGGICIPKGQMTYDCICKGAWRGIHCVIADACYRSPCQNGGTCLNVGDDYWCKCTSDYYGTNCQTRVYSPTNSGNHCRPNICNTGRCVSLSTTYYCQCPDGRYGEHCEKGYSKRKISSLQLYYDLLHQIKRGMVNKDMRQMNKLNTGDDRA